MGIDKNVRFLLKTLNSYRKIKFYLNSADSQYNPHLIVFLITRQSYEIICFLTYQTYYPSGIEVEDVILKDRILNNLCQQKLKEKKIYLKNLKKDIELKEILLKLIKMILKKIE